MGKCGGPAQYSVSFIEYKLDTIYLYMGVVPKDYYFYVIFLHHSEVLPSILSVTMFANISSLF